MAAVSGAIPNLIGGVSQQPPEIRALNSSTSLVNSWSDVATGLSTRPAGAFLGHVGAAPGGSLATHMIQKPAGNYQLCVDGTRVRVFNVTTGKLETVRVEGGANSYLASSDSSRDIGFLTVGDTTFLYNRSVRTAKTTSADGSGMNGRVEDGVRRLNPNRMATYWVRQRAGYHASYALYVNNVRRANFSSDEASPSQIARQLRLQMATAGFTVQEPGQTVHSVTLNAEDDFLTATDDFADQAIRVYNDSIGEYTDLANSDREGRLVLIRQSEDEVADDWWVWRNGGKWEETYGWNAYEAPQVNTMPVVLFDNGNGTWTLRRHQWPGRTVGDEDSNPTPSFIGNTINSMFIHKGRMVILADENFIASRVGDLENFYRSTGMQLVDDDPIDIASPDSRGASARFAVEFDQGLLMFTALDQFKIEGADGLMSPNTVSIRHANSYNCSPRVAPVIAGPNIIFVDDYDGNRFVALREYQVERVFGREIALSITDQVPEYIPGGVHKMVSSSSKNMIAVLTSGRPNSLWLYNYYHNADGKVQSSWQEWTMPGRVLSAEFVNDQLLATISYGGNLISLLYDFDTDSDLYLDDKSILLDLRVQRSDVTVEHNANNLFVTLPYDVEAKDVENFALVISPISPGSRQGRFYRPAGINGRQLRFTGIQLAANEQFSIGMRFKFEWKLSPIYMRDQNLVAVQDGRLQLRRISFLYNHSGPFRVHVTPEGRDTYTSVFSGFLLGNSQNVLNSLSLESGSFKVSSNGRSDTVQVVVEAWTPWRVRFSSIEWDGMHRPRKRRTM